MARARRRVASKSSKRRKGHATPARGKVTKRAAPKKAKRKVRKKTQITQKSTAKKKQLPKTAERKARKALRRPSEQTTAASVADIITHVVDEPSSSAVPVTEHEVVRTIAPEPNRDSETKEE
jgi:hypothetical protein